MYIGGEPLGMFAGAYPWPWAEEIPIYDAIVMSTGKKAQRIFIGESPQLQIKLGSPLSAGINVTDYAVNESKKCPVSPTLALPRPCLRDTFPLGNSYRRGITVKITTSVMKRKFSRKVRIHPEKSLSPNTPDYHSGKIGDLHKLHSNSLQLRYNVA